MIEIIKNNYMEICTVGGFLLSLLVLTWKFFNKNSGNYIKELETILQQLSGCLPEVDDDAILTHLNNLKTCLEFMENKLSGESKKRCRQLIKKVNTQLSSRLTAEPTNNTQLIEIRLDLQSFITWLQKMKNEKKLTVLS